MKHLKNLLVISFITLGLTWNAYADFIPKSGEYTSRTFGDYIFHVYSTPLQSGASNAIVIETPNQLVMLGGMQNKSNVDELKSLIRSLNKPLKAILLSHDHDHHWAGLQEFEGTDIYSDAVARKSMQTKGDEALAKLRKQFGTDKVPYTKVMVPNKLFKTDDILEFDGLRIRAAKSPVNLTGPLHFFEFIDQKIIVLHHLAYNSIHATMAPIEPRIEYLEGLRGKYDWYLAGHGKPAGPEFVDITIDYFDTLKKVLATKKTLAEVKSEMMAKYPKYGAAFFMDFMLLDFFK